MNSDVWTINQCTPRLQSCIQQQTVWTETGYYNNLLKVKYSIIYSVFIITVTQESVHIMLAGSPLWNTLHCTCCFSELTPVHSLCCTHGRSETCSVPSLNLPSNLCAHTHTHTHTHAEETNQQLAVWWSNLNQWIFFSHFNPLTCVHALVRACVCVLVCVWTQGHNKGSSFMREMDSFPILLFRF